MRMNQVALKLIMSNDVKKVSSWFGYQKNIKYAIDERAGDSFGREEELYERRW
jgi:hypothetical protein